VIDRIPFDQQASVVAARAAGHDVPPRDVSVPIRRLTLEDMVAAGGFDEYFSR
jgi:hypothetical protein